MRVVVATDWTHPIVVSSALKTCAGLVSPRSGVTVAITSPRPPTPCNVAAVQHILGALGTPVEVALTLESFAETRCQPCDVAVVPNGRPLDLVSDLGRLVATLLGVEAGPGAERLTDLPARLDAFREPTPLEYATASAVPSIPAMGVGHPDNARCVIPITSSNDPRVTIGRFSYGPVTFRLWTPQERIVIGSFTSMAQDVKLFGGGEHFSDFVTTYPLRVALGDPVRHRDGYPASRGTTTIGSDVWIGDGVQIMSGVTIGDGAIVGAGTVVARDVPPYAVVVGNPARVVRYRFDQTTVRRLLAIAWWEWPLSRIERLAHLLSGPHIDAFLAAAELPTTNRRARTPSQARGPDAQRAS